MTRAQLCCTSRPEYCNTVEEQENDFKTKFTKMMKVFKEEIKCFKEIKKKDLQNEGNQ